MSDPLPENPTQDIIWAVVGALVDRFKSTMSGVQIVAGWPGDKLQKQAVWISEIFAESREVPGFVGDTRVLVDEVYSVLFEVEVHGLATMEATQARVSEIIGDLDSIVREDPRLGELGGLISALFTTPFKRTCGLSNEGYQGYAQLNLEVRTRLY